MEWWEERPIIYGDNNLTHPLEVNFISFVVKPQCIFY